MPERFKFIRRITPLAIVQFIGVFNDHAFKITAVLAATMQAASGSAGTDYSKDSAFLALITIVFVLPFLTFAQPAGYLSDRYQKRYVIIFAKVAELAIMLLGSLALYNVSRWGIMPLVGIMFLMASQTSFFSPAFNGIIPEIFHEKDISHANGNINMATFLAVILGVGGAFIFKSLVQDDVYKIGIIFSVLSFISLLTSFKVYPGKAGNRKLSWSGNMIKKYFSAFTELWKNQPVFISVVADGFFMAVGTVIQTILVVYAKYTLKMTQEIEWGILQLIPAFGIGFGSYLAGRLSGRKIELGMVPLGAFGMLIGMILIALYPGTGIILTLSATASITLFPYVILYLTILGISGGFFIVPLRATQQQHTDPESRGTILANANVICFTAILIAGLAMLLFTSGDTSGAQTGLFAELQKYCLSFNPQNVFITLAGSIVVFCVIVFYFYPIFLFRFLIFIITHTLYKLRITGQENIPEKGPVLLLSNHTSFIDALLIMSCTSRHVHFLMHEDFYRYPLLYPFVKWAGFIEVPDPRHPKQFSAMLEDVRQRLTNGEIICVFPEGKITRNGVMDQFKSGITKMVPDEVDVPVIPIRLGMIWGSMFSYYYGKIVFKLPNELPHPATVTIGKPISKKSTPYQMRRIISEMAAETEMVPRANERPLHYHFAKFAKRHPFRKLIIDHNGKSLSNFKLLVSSVILSRKLKLLTEDSQYVGILLPNMCGTSIAILATLMADNVPAMLNFTASKETLDACIKKAGIKQIITSRQFIAKAKIEQRNDMIFLEDLIKEITKKERIWNTLMTLLLPHQELLKFLAPETHRDVFKPAILLFSSGSTSEPKGVLLSHHNINSNVYCCIRIMGWTRHDSILGNLPLFHSFGITTCFWLPLMLGAKVVNVPNPLDVKATGEAIEKHQLTVMLVTPTFLQTYMRKCTADQFKSLRIVIAGAEKMRPDIARRFKNLTGLSVIEGYGCTELSPIVSINVANSFLDLGTEAGKPGSVGVPMPGICTKIVDPSDFAELPPDHEGLLFVKGPNVMMGYLGDREKTDEVIIDGWYNTGDMARIAPNGYITIVGRLSRFSKIGGEMVPHEMIESKIYDYLNSEERCLAVTGRPDKAKGEKLVVFYTDKMLVPPEQIISYLKQAKLANLWIPKRQNFYKIDSIPILGSGKLNLQELNKINPEETIRGQD